MTIDELNRRYGAPGRIVFRAGHCGYPEVALANRFGTAEVALLGANVLSYKPTGHAPVIFRPDKRDYNRGESFHGGIPLCWPQFGNKMDKTLPQHGFARIMPFSVAGTQYSEEMTEVTLALESSDETKKIWPNDFRIEMKISVSMKLNLKLVTENRGEKPFRYSAGFHPYIVAGDRDACWLRGADGCDYVDAADMSSHLLCGDLPMNVSRDLVFSLPPALKHEAVLVDGSLKRAVAVVSSGNTRLVVWNPGPEGRLSDFKDGDWRKFVCVEPVTAWPQPERELAPGEKESLTAAIQSTLDTSA